MSRQGKGTPTLVAVIDQFSRYIVSWKPFDTMHAKEIVACARQAFVKHVTFSIMNFREGSVFGFYKYAVAARLYACGAEPEQKGPDGGTTPSCKDGSRRSRANACGRKSTARLPELKSDHREARHAWYNEERIHHALSCGTPAQWYRSIVCEAACPSMVLSGWGDSERIRLSLSYRFGHFTEPEAPLVHEETLRSCFQRLCGKISSNNRDVLSRHSNRTLLVLQAQCCGTRVSIRLPT